MIKPAYDGLPQWVDSDQQIKGDSKKRALKSGDSQT